MNNLCVAAMSPISYRFAGNSYSGQRLRTIDRFEYNGLKVRFFKPYAFCYEIIDGLFYFRDNKLGIDFFDSTLADLLESFYDFFTMLLKMYLDKADSELTNDAIKLRNYLMGICEAI